MNGFALLLGPLVLLLIGSIPMGISIVLTLYATGWRRWLAASTAAVAGLILAFEIYSSTQGGNLTGLIWMLTTPILFLFMLAVVILQGAARRRSKRASDDLG
jgi:hypothetical protein